MSSSARADEREETIKKAIALKLADDPTWRKLLHYESGKDRSSVLSDTFFLSSNGKVDPEAELVATINAYFEKTDKDANESARCRFPARYYWLSQNMDLPDYHFREDRCNGLEKWALFDRVKSVSVLLVSGYLGNPASTFGHALLKLNTDSSDDQTGLFDLTLNYGAMVPDNENALVYVFRGLLGGYKAGFSDKYFYTQDLVYSRTEFRDMWDYRLNLSEYQRNLLILHVWEIAGKKFTYYFLNKNCAYMLADLLGIVVDDDLVHAGKPWYLPVELIYHLRQIDGIFDSISFIPSSQRVLYRQLQSLDKNELSVFNDVLKNGPGSMSRHLKVFDDAEQSRLLDSLLAYEKYKLIGEEPHPTQDRLEFKRQILSARLQLPPQKEIKYEIKELPSPAEATRPMVVGLRVASELRKDSKSPFMLLNWAVFKQDIVGRNSLAGNELVAFDVDLGFWEEKGTAFVDRVDLLRILNINTFDIAVEGESRLSWELRVGANRIEKNAGNEYDGSVTYGVGRAWKWNENFLSYGMVDLSAHTLSSYARIRPYVAFKFDLGELRPWFYFGAESENYGSAFQDVWGAKIQYTFSPRYAINAELSNTTATRASVGLSTYW